MTVLDFAIWDGVGGYSGTGESMADVYDDHIRLAEELERLGFHSYFCIEHQNSPVGRITSPTVFLTAIVCCLVFTQRFILKGRDYRTVTGKATAAGACAASAGRGLAGTMAGAEATGAMP